MKKIICLLLAATMMLLTLASCDTGKLTELSIAEVSEPFTVGTSIQLCVVDAAKKSVDADRVIWSTSDKNVAEITAAGILTVKNAGYCEITAVDRNDLSNRDTLQVFCPYATTAPVEMVKTPANSTDASGEVDFMVKTAVDLGKNVVRSLTGSVSLLGIGTMMLSFFSKDKYTFTLAETKYDVQNGVIYTVCDWSNQAWYTDLNKITGESIYKNLGYIMNTEHIQGKTLDDLADAVKAEIIRQFPADGKYHLDLMDPNYEYRVVILADYTTFRMKDFYSNGAITGLGLTIQEICTWSLESIADVNNNWMYEVVTNDVINVQNIRLCVEYREKQ